MTRIEIRRATGSCDDCGAPADCEVEAEQDLFAVLSLCRRCAVGYVRELIIAEIDSPPAESACDPMRE